MGPQWGGLWGGGLKEGDFVSSILDFGESREFASLLLSYTET